MPKKIGHLIFYSLPKNALLYRELIMNLQAIEESGSLSREKARRATLKAMIKSVFCKFDALTIERIVGSEKCKEYIAEYNKNTTFVL
jgi:hypothetical protein